MTEWPGSITAITLFVDDIEGPKLDGPWSIRTASLRDPAGPLWEIAK